MEVAFLLQPTQLRIEGKSDVGRAPFKFLCSILSVGLCMCRVPL